MFSRETIELESQLNAAMRSRRAGVSQSDPTTQLHALEMHNTDLQVFFLDSLYAFSLPGWLGSLVFMSVGLTAQCLQVRFPADATNTAIGDRLWLGKPPQYFTKPPRPTQSPTLSGTGNDYQPTYSVLEVR